MNNDYRRAIHIDFHTLPGIYDINEFDAEKFGKTLFDARATFVNIFAQCNMGFCYYPTKIGVVYPGLKRDLLGEMIEVLHRYGIGVAAYFNVGLNHAVLHKHPEWRTVDKEGKTEKPPVNEKGEDNVWITNGCFYNKGYKEYLKSLVKEVADNYDIDGIFCA